MHELKVSPRSPASSGGSSETLVDVLQYRAAHQPDRNAFTFLPDGETDGDTLTYAELDRRARSIAVALQQFARPGDRALLLYPQGLDFLTGFFGCLYAGVIAIPAQVPRPNRADLRIRSMIADASPAVTLTVSSVPRKQNLPEDLFAGPVLATDELSDRDASSWTRPVIGAGTLALLQYTSGSTTTPRGVMISHGNLLHNSKCLLQSQAFSPQSIGVTWLPHFHDMGLVGGLLQPLVHGFVCYLLPATAFIQQPARWLAAISRYRATVSVGPNFAYDLCLRRVPHELLSSFDLSCWSLAINGAEPVRPDTLERFCQVFGACGFRREAFYPTYGLAEATLQVSGGLKGSLPRHVVVSADALTRHRVEPAAPSEARTQKFVSSGSAVLDTQLAIVDPETLVRCPERRVGEVWVRSPSVAVGYWNRPEETASTFNAHLSGTGEGPFLRTGDLGFLLEGELYVSGRLKEVIIVNGRNHYPHDIELTVEQSHSAVRPGGCAVFSTEVGGEEGLAVIVEVDREFMRGTDSDGNANARYREIASNVRQAIAEQHDLRLDAIQVLKPGSIPRTSSGKIQRHLCRERSSAGNLEPIWEWSISTGSANHSSAPGGMV